MLYSVRYKKHCFLDEKQNDGKSDFYSLENYFMEILVGDWVVIFILFLWAVERDVPAKGIMILFLNTKEVLLMDQSEYFDCERILQYFAFVVLKRKGK